MIFYRKENRENKMQVLCTISILRNTVKWEAEVWLLNHNLKSKVMSMGMDFLRQSARHSKLEKRRNK